MAASQHQFRVVGFMSASQFAALVHQVFTSG